MSSLAKGGKKGPLTQTSEERETKTRAFFFPGKAGTESKMRLILGGQSEKLYDDDDASGGQKCA